MEFSGQYLTYQEYLCLGGTLGPMPFNLLEFELRRKIDGKTLNRLVGIENIPNEVKLCLFNLMNSTTKYFNVKDNILNNGNVASENIDGYSVSYLTPSAIKDVIETHENELDNIIQKDLFGVIVNGEHIIYSGI